MVGGRKSDAGSRRFALNRSWHLRRLVISPDRTSDGLFDLMDLFNTSLTLATLASTAGTSTRQDCDQHHLECRCPCPQKEPTN
jgi:hypothetical protein